MAFTKSPTMDTYSSEKIDLTREIALRAGNVLNKDEDFVNVFLEDIKSKYASDNRSFIVKRDGTRLGWASLASGVIRGSHYWADQDKLFFAVARNLYYIILSTGVTHTFTNFFSGSTGTVGFADYIYDNGTMTLLLSDGVGIAQVTAADVVSSVVDPDLPTPHDPNLIFFDGYVFVTKVGTGDIFGSEANDPFTWDPSNVINAEIEADTIVRLHKINNYMIAFGKTSIEYFWDAGNATGSPLQRNDTPVKRITYLMGLSQNDNHSYFIGQDFDGKISVYKMQDFKCDKISTVSIDRYLTYLGQVMDYSTWNAGVVAFSGHCFYFINAGTDRTYVLDCESEIWTRMSFQNQAIFPILQSHVVTGPTKTSTSLFFLNDGTSNVYVFDSTLYQDVGVNFPCVIVTESNDFGTLNRKNMHRLSFYGDRPPIDSDILIQWTDDDYQTFNSGVTTNLNQDLACIRQLGNFRQRSFKLTFTNNTLMRLQSMVADINKGSS